jgi:hypothetical protein
MRILGRASARVWCRGRQTRIEGERSLALSQHGDCDQTSRERSDDCFVGALRRRTLHPLIFLRAHHSDSLSGAFHFSNGRQTVSRFLHARTTYRVSRSPSTSLVFRPEDWASGHKRLFVDTNTFFNYLVFHPS